MQILRMFLLTIFSKHLETCSSLGENANDIFYRLFKEKMFKTNSLVCNCSIEIKLALSFCFKLFNCQMLIFDWVATYSKKENFSKRI